MIIRKIPSTGEEIPVIGCGSWQTFDVSAKDEKENLAQVLKILHQGGGRLIDTSPMYGRSESVIGETTVLSGFADSFFYATKVWTTGEKEGLDQIHRSMKLLGRTELDLVQVHNLLDWKTQMKTLNRLKKEGIIRYTGITHYTDSMHHQLAEVVKVAKPDFVQVNYSIRSRNAEKELFPACRESGTAVIINRPFAENSILKKLKERPLPAIAIANGCTTWPELILKYIIAQDAVTCIIPATCDPDHMLKNVSAAHGWIPEKNEITLINEYFNGHKL